MATRRARRPYRWLRRGVLLVLVLVVVGVVGLYWFGRQQRQPPPRRSSPLKAEAPTAHGVTTVGQGFEYTHYEAGRKRFTLRALRTLEDREETVFLEGVDMLVFEEQGQGYELSADRARYNRERQQALLEGNVRLSSGTGMTLGTEGLELSQKGRLLTSTHSAEIVYGEAWKAVGDRFRVHVPEDLFLLTGNVRVDAIPGRAEPFSLGCERLQFERDRQMLRADGGVEIVRPDSRVTARSVNAFLTEDLSAVRFLRARWEVEGTTRMPGRLGADEMGPPPATRVRFSGRSLSTLIRTDGTAPESSQLEGSPAEPAVLRSTDGSGVTRVITAGYLTSDLRPDGGQRVEAYGDPEIVEEVALAAGADGGLDGEGSSRLDGPPEPVRRLKGGRGWADLLPDGSLGRAEMMEGVEYRDGALWIRGESGTFDLAAGSGVFYGSESEEAPEAPAGPPPPDVPPRKPVPRVTLVHPRGELVAPTVSYTEEDGIVHARDGVATELRESLPMLGTSDGAEGPGEPAQVQSREAFFRDVPRGALFRGDVRAWQGESVVLAEWLRVDEEEHKVTAGGGVRTVAAPSPTRERPEPTPLTVTAEQMTYVDPGRGGAGDPGGGAAELVYERGVRVEDQGREIACERLDVELGEDGQAQRLVATGAVVLEDSRTGKEARAERAVWRPQKGSGEGEMALFGDPAVVTDARGTEIKAPELTYEMATGRVRAGTSVPPATAPQTTTPGTTAPGTTTPDTTEPETPAGGERAVGRAR